MKSLKIPSESINRRRTDNTMAKRKSTKGQNSSQISTLVLLSLDRCLDRRTINIRGNYSSSSHCFGTDIAH